MPIDSPAQPSVAIIGGGPAGLMAAQVLAGGGVRADVFDAMPSIGRKFLLAGKGGLNLTHSEAFESFVGRYAQRRSVIGPLLESFGPAAVREWAQGLGIDTFVGSSGRVFPRDLKAAPLLRAWLHRLRSIGVRFNMRHRCVGLAPVEGAAWRLQMSTPQGPTLVDAPSVVFALGGASWPQLGSDGAWAAWLADAGADIAPLAPANCGFDVARAGPGSTVQPGWSEHFRSRFAGTPVKTAALHWGSAFTQRGEFVITAGGVEGGLVYAASAALRSEIDARGHAVAHLDLLPDRSADWVRAEVARPRGSRSLATHLKSRLHIDGVKAALLHELLARETVADPAALAVAIKALPIRLAAARPVTEAISSAGGVRFEALTEGLMLRELPGVFCAGEMLDWEAPTGGYLLTACLATGAAAGRGVLRYLGSSGDAGAKSAAVSSIGAPCGVRSAA